MSRVLVLSNEPVGKAMAGPAIRATALAHVLSQAGHDVTLRDTEDRGEVRRLAGESEVVVLQGWALERVPALADAGARLVVDLYDPFSLELLVLIESRSADEREVAQANALRALHDQLRAGDFFLCASERQRDYWLGWLEAAGRVNPRTHANDPDLRALIDVVPFGVPSEAPERSGEPGPRELFGIAADEVMLLWGGGLYDWLDPVTVVRAVERVEGVHLVLMAGGHANPQLPAAQVLEAAREAAMPRVHFQEEWVEVERWGDWLLDADVGVSAHHDSVEARFAFRTRILGYLWAGLPILCTRGDALADEVERADLGAALAPGDVDGWATEIERLAVDPARREQCGARAADLASRLTWDRVAGSLLAYCATPHRATDLAAGGPLSPTRDSPLSRRRLAALARRLGISR
jgi:glycosyltransferase involved in cell wall biosynthesis